jgi:hypothetical protein
MNALPMPVDHFEMAPLSEFVVTFKDHTKPKELPKVDWNQWCAKNGNPKWDLNGKELRMLCDKPKDVEPILSDQDVRLGYFITWEDDQP